MPHIAAQDTRGATGPLSQSSPSPEHGDGLLQAHSELQSRTWTTFPAPRSPTDMLLSCLSICPFFRPLLWLPGTCECFVTLHLLTWVQSTHLISVFCACCDSVFPLATNANPSKTSWVYLKNYSIELLFVKKQLHVPSVDYQMEHFSLQPHSI